GHAIVLLLPIGLAQLETRLRVVLVQARRLREVVVALLGRGGEQTAYVALHRVQTDGGADSHVLLLGGGGFRIERRQYLPSQVRLQRGEVFQRAGLTERGTLARALAIDDARRDAQRPFGRLLAWIGGQEFEETIDDFRGVQRFADFEDGRMRQLGVGPQRE